MIRLPSGTHETGTQDTETARRIASGDLDALGELTGEMMTGWGAGRTASSITKVARVGKAADAIYEISPKLVRFSQRTVNDVAAVAKSMRRRGWRGAPIDVVEMADGGFTAVDNTRVLAAHRAGIDVHAVIHGADELLPAESVGRFTTKAGVPRTWGDAIRLRIQNQGAAYRKRYPSGSPITGAME